MLFRSSTLFGTTQDGKFQKNNLIELPSTDGSEGVKSLVQQLITWKPGAKGAYDCVMALWFAVIRARELMQQASNISYYTNNRWATRLQVAKRQVVNLDEMQNDNWQQLYG